MILNLLRVEGISPEFMLERCFHQFQNTASVSGLERELQQLESQKSTMVIEDESNIRAYYELRKQLDVYAEDMRMVIIHPNYCLPFMQPGRLVEVKDGEHDFGWGAVMNFSRRDQKRSAEKLPPQEEWVLDVALEVAEGAAPATKTHQSLPPGIRPPQPGERSKVEVVPVLLKCVHRISHVRIYPPSDMTLPDEKKKVQQALAEVRRRFPDGLAVLDPIENMKITDNSFRELLRKIEIMESRLVANPLHLSPRLEGLYNQYAEKMQLTTKIRNLKKQIQDAHAITQLDELKCRKRVLRRLQFINEDEVVQLKARVACEISTGDELMLSELLFNRFFNDMTPEQCAAVMSCFVFEEKVNDNPVLSPELSRALREIQAQARTIAKVSVESKLPLNEEEYVQSFKWQLMPVMYAWATGKSFGDIW
jgi:ATP-dependent RNA helicase DOB1